MANFDYAFWNLHPNILAHGKQCFEDLAEHFGIDVYSQELSDIEDRAKNDVLAALSNAYFHGENPFVDSKAFLLENLINACKLNCLISHICESQGLNYEDFEHNAYEDGALLNVTYKHKKIS